MKNNAALFAWRRSLPGREQMSATHFEDFVSYLMGLQNDGKIDSFEPVLLEPNSSGIIGFVLIRADNGRLNELLNSDAWDAHLVRAMFHLDQPALLRGVTGAAAQELMGQWRAGIPA
jgi:hypothetical protein